MITKPWVDEVTGHPAQNPFPGLQDLESCRVIRKRDPALAEHLKLMAKGVTYSHFTKLQDERTAREKQRTLSYSKKEAAVNPWVTNNLTDQMAFAREADPITVEFWKKEAGPVELSFQNLTVAGQRSENDPATRALWERGMEIGAWWAEEDQRNSLAEVKAAEQRLAVAKKRAVANSRPRV